MDGSAIVSHAIVFPPASAASLTVRTAAEPPRPGLLRRLRQRAADWVAARTKRRPGPWPIDRRRVYIVPTRHGYGFALLLFVMLLGAMNYSNSMAFALTFLLSGIGLLAMHHTHGNLVNLQLRALPVEPVFAGEPLCFRFALDNPSARPRHALALAWPRTRPAQQADIAAGESAELSLLLADTARGRMPAPRFSVETEFPLGLFHAWTWVELDTSGLVYPRPAAPGLPIPDRGRSAGTETGAGIGDEEFAGLREYQPGDALRRVHWKRWSGQQAPVVKLYADAEAPECWLAWSRLPAHWETEQRLSQLTRWLLDCEAAARPYGLSLPGFEREPGLGGRHAEACLEALALHGGSGA